jgi:hypothetical protein
MLSRGGAAAAETDPNFKQTVLLLHGDGTNGAQNNTFLDSSTNNFTITRNPATGPNAPTQGTFSPFSVGAGEWAAFINNANSYVSYGSNADFTFGTGDFTVEAWVYVSSIGASQYFNIFNVGGATTGSYGIYVNPNGTIQSVRYGDAASSGITTNALVFNTWNHIAAVRSGGTAKVYINGVADSGSSYSMGNVTASAAETGRLWQIAYTASGYVSNLRVCKGTAVYTTNFTPSTAPLTSTSQSASNCKLLTLQSNRFVDTNTAVSAKTITTSGSPTVTPFSPFAPSAAYDPAVNGGSGYFDGTGDYLSISSNISLTGNFTIESWVYLTGMGGGYPQIISTGTSGNVQFGIWIDNRLYVRYPNGVTYLYSTGTIRLNTWTYVAAKRSGTTLELYINGTVDGSATTSADFSYPTTNIGGYGGGTANGFFQGYISALRVTNTALTISVPSTPPTSVSGTQLLTNFTNAGIFDNTGKNNLETVGNAQIDTTTKKYGTGSMEFDGTGDRLIIPPTQDLDLTTGDFTVEAWIYTNTIAAGVAVFAYRGSTAVTLSTDIQWSMYRNGSSLIVRPYSSTTDYTINIGTIAANTWYHVAFTRSGSTFRGFLNGTVSATTQTISGSLNNNATWSGSIIGSMTEGGVDRGFNGFIDDLRITKGVARYTANFTAPTKAFPDQ